MQSHRSRSMPRHKVSLNDSDSRDTLLFPKFQQGLARKPTLHTRTLGRATSRTRADSSPISSPRLRPSGGYSPTTSEIARPYPSLPSPLIGRLPLRAPPLGDVSPLPSESRRRVGGAGRGVVALLSWRREAGGGGGGHSPAEVAANRPRLRRSRAAPSARSRPLAASQAAKGAMSSGARARPG